MTAFFEKIVEMSANAAVVIPVVLLVRLLLRKAPRKYSYALWAVAAFRLVCPVSFRSVFSIFALTEGMKLPVNAQPAAAPPVGTVTPDVIATVPPTVITTPPPAAATPPAVTVTPPAVTEPITSAVSFWDVAAVIWLAVLAGLLIYGVVSYVLIRRRMAKAVLLEGRVYQSDRVRSPFILGFMRPRIYLPFGLTEEQQRYVLAHERYHLRRGDHIVRPLAFLILAVHWFNPLVWAAYYLMGRDMEMSCDEKVLGGADNIRRAYSLTLLSFAANRRFPAPGPLAFGETGVKGRVKNILNWKKPALWVTIVAIAAVIAVLLVCGADPARTSEGITPEQEGEYRTVECIYMTPLSSYLALDGSDGYEYTVATDHVMRGSVRLEVASDWEELTEERWNEMDFLFYSTLKEQVGEHRSQRILTLSNNMYLMEMDGELWIAHLSSDPNGRTYFWSIFRMAKEGEILSSDEELPEAEYTTYVTVKCVFQPPVMSAIMPDDNGKLYLIGADRVTVLDREGREEAVHLTDPGPWQTPTEEEWNALFWGGVWTPDIGGYETPRLRWFSENTALADLDGTLWILLRPELDSGLSDRVFFAYELAPATMAAAPTGWYRSTECLYMSGLSSWIPRNGDSGYIYGIEGDTLTLVHNGSLPTLGDSTGHTYHHAAESGWQVLSEETWKEMTGSPLIFSGLSLWDEMSQSAERYIRRYENRYFLLSMDGELWVGRDSAHPNGETYLWELYRLTLAGSPEITVENKLSISADLNRSGGADLITVSYDHVGETYRLEISESYGMATLLEWEFHRMDTAAGGYYLCSRDGEDYLLWWAPYCQQGVWHLFYEVFSFGEGGSHEVLISGLREYDASHIGMEHLTADLDDLRAFEREINALLANSVPILVNRTAEGGDVLIGPQGGPVLWASPADEWEAIRQACQEETNAREKATLAVWPLEGDRLTVTVLQNENDSYTIDVCKDDYYFWGNNIHRTAGTLLYFRYQDDYLMELSGGGQNGDIWSYRIFSVGPESLNVIRETQDTILTVDSAALRDFEAEVNELLEDAVLIAGVDGGKFVYNTPDRIVNVYRMENGRVISFRDSSRAGAPG